MTISFFVAGQPVPQGSSRAFVKNGKAIITSTSGQSLKDWRGAIAGAAREHTDSVFVGPVRVVAHFVLPRPKSLPKRDVRPWADKKPDIDKILRACLDALTGVVYSDDAQVVSVMVTKIVAAVGEQPGVRVSIEEVLV